MKHPGQSTAEKYMPDECGDPDRLTGATLLELQNTRKHSIFSYDDLYYELVSKNQNIGYFKMRHGRQFITKYGVYDKNIIKQKEFGMFDLTIDLDRKTILRGIMSKPDKWWQLNKINYYDFNNQEYFFKVAQPKGFWGGAFHQVTDANDNLIMHISARDPHKPISFEFYNNPNLEVKEITHALLFMLIEKHFEYQQNDVVIV